MPPSSPDQRDPPLRYLPGRDRARLEAAFAPRPRQHGVLGYLGSVCVPTTMKETRMKRMFVMILALAVAAGFSAASHARSVAASSPRSGVLHVAKECSAYTGLAG